MYTQAVIVANRQRLYIILLQLDVELVGNPTHSSTELLSDKTLFMYKYMVHACATSTCVHENINEPQLPRLRTAFKA